MTVRVTNLPAVLGAEIDGVDLTGELSGDDVRALRDAFDDRGVLILRGLDIDDDAHRYLAGLLSPDEPPADRAEAIAGTHLYDKPVSNEPGGNAPYGRLLFHSDAMWNPTPMRLLSLYGTYVEQPAVPTIFASATHAWDTLPADLKARVEGLEVVHVTGQQPRGGYVEELLEATRSESSETVTPIAKVHPRSGRTMLYVCQQMTREVVGMPHDESEALLEELFAHLYAEDVLVEHHWREGDLVLWDNLAIQHSRPNVQFDGPKRTLRKVIDRSMGATTNVPTFAGATAPAGGV
jgi:taurine dioxygenase